MEEQEKGHLGAYTCIFNNSFSEMLLLWRTKETRNWEEIKGWGNIGGSFEPGETALQTCIREAKEEIGVDLNPNKLIPVGTKTSPEGSAHKWAIYFYATSIDEHTKIKLNDESRGYGWFERDELPECTLDSKEELIGWWDLAETSLERG